MDRIYIALAAFLGGILIALAGWWDSHEAFDKRKFGASIIRSLFAAVVFAIGYHLSGPVTVLDLFYALLGGSGTDKAINAVAGALGNGAWPLPVPAKPETPTPTPTPGGPPDSSTP